MVDLSTFSNNADSARFEQTMQSTRTAGIRNLYISNKGIPKYPWFGDLANAASFVSPNNNANATVRFTFGGGQPAVSFMGEWKSNSTHVLAYYELGNQDWI